MGCEAVPAEFAVSGGHCAVTRNAKRNKRVWNFLIYEQTNSEKKKNASLFSKKKKKIRPTGFPVFFFHRPVRDIRSSAPSSRGGFFAAIPPSQYISIFRFIITNFVLPSTCRFFFFKLNESLCVFPPLVVRRRRSRNVHLARLATETRTIQKKKNVFNVLLNERNPTGLIYYLGKRTIAFFFEKKKN